MDYASIKVKVNHVIRRILTGGGLSLSSKRIYIKVRVQPDETRHVVGYTKNEITRNMNERPSDDWA